MARLDRVTVGVRVSPERRETLRKIAAIEGRTMSNMAARWLDRCIAMWERDQKAKGEGKETL